MGLRGADPSLWFNLPGVVAAYQPIVAPDALTGLQNMAHGGDGRHAAAPGTAPTWLPGVGWTFNGLTQYLTIGIVPEFSGGQSTLSMLVRFNGANTDGGTLCGQFTSGARFDLVARQLYQDKHSYGNGDVVLVEPRLDSGVMAIAGTQGYLNGVADGAAIAAGYTAAATQIGIGARGDGTDFYAGNIQAFLFCERILTSAEVWLASQQMMRCDTIAAYSVWAPARRWFFIPPPPPAAATPVLSTIYINSADIGDTSLFDDVSGAVVSTSYARTGTYSFKLAGGDSLQANLTSSATKYTKFGLLVTDAPVDNHLLVAWQETGTEHVSLYLTKDLQLQMLQGERIIQTSPTTLETERWYCVESKIVVHDTIGRFQVRIDGVDDMTAIGINTDDGVDGTINEIRFESPVDDTYIDDIVVREDQWCGIGGVYVVVPAASGTYSEWSGAYSSVDELPPSFTDYISATTTGGNESTFRHSGLTTDYSQIPVVGVFAKIRIDAAADVAANAAAYSNEEFAAGDAQDLDETGVYARLLMTINPDGSAVWTAATVDALEIGIKA